jgi:tRNA threonylcarbamoyladenosine biosynthesis protein TsaE
LYHFDFYRLEHAQDWIAAGFREHFDGTAVCLVEWPEKAGGTLPAADVAVRLELADAGRTAFLHAVSDAGARCLSVLPEWAGARA